MPSRRSNQAKNLSGTARADRVPKPEMAERLRTPPKSPPNLSDRAKAEWDRVAPAVVGLGTLTSADLRAFELLAQTLATATEATEALATDGLSVRTGDGGLKPHPAVRIMETARMQARALLAEFGLTPRGRQGVDVHPLKQGPSPFDEFMNDNPFQRHARKDGT